MSPTMPFLQGALALGTLAIGVKFLKYWIVSRDRFFLWFVGAFAAFAIGWTIQGLGIIADEHGHMAYLPRLVGFLLIIVAIVDKNRRPPPGG